MNLPHVLIGHGTHKVLVLHGWFGDESLLQPMVPALDEDTFSFAGLAHRGCGAALALHGDYTLDEMAADALDTADALGWPCFSVIGHSMGGKVAQALLARAPHRVQRIVAVTPVPAGAVPFDDAGWALFTGAATNLAQREAIIDFSTGQRLSPAWVRGLAARSWAGSRPDAFAAYLRAWAQTDIAAQVQGATAPLLALVGEHDPHLTAEVVQATYGPAFRHFQLEVLANAGHYPMDETPVALATRIQRFLAPADGP